MSGWKITYDNDTGPNDEGYWEWWNVSNDELGLSYKCNTEKEAKYLLEAFKALDEKKVKSQQVENDWLEWRSRRNEEL